MEMKVSQVGCFQITGHWICYYIFSDTSFIEQDFCQKCYEETILFQLKFQKPILRCSILPKIKMSNFLILKWRPFEAKKLKNLSIFGDVFSEIKKADILNFSWIK